ncbi:MAG: AsmA family protein [Pseudomonadota bacterium]
MLKKLLIAIPVLLVVVIIGIVIAFKFIDDQFIETQALKQLESALNRKVTIDGHFSLTRTTRPTLTATGIEIASASWDSNNYLLKADDITIQVDAVPLLFGIISFENIIFDNTTFNIIRNKEGDSNLDFTGKKESSGSIPYRPKIDRVEMNNLVVNYEDWAKDSKLHINTKSLSIDAVDEETIQLKAVSNVNEQPIEISSKMCRLFMLFGDEFCKVTAQVDTFPFKTKVSGDIDLEENGYINMAFNTEGENVNELKLPFKTYLPDTNSAQASFTLTGALNAIQLSKLKTRLTFDDSTANLSGEIKSLNSLSGVQLKFYAEGTDGKWLDLYQDQFPGELIDHFTAALELENHNEHWKLDDIEASVTIDDTTLFSKGEILLSEDPLDLNLNINGRGKHPEWLDKIQDDINAKYIDDIRVDFDLIGKDETWSIKNLESIALTEDHTFTANGNIAFSTDNTTEIELDFTSSGRNLYSLARIIKQNLPESKKFHIQSKLKYKKPTLSLINTDIIIDETSIQGNSEIDFVSPPNIRAQLESKSLDIEHVIALTEDLDDSQKAQRDTTSEKDSLFSDKPLNLDWLDQANTDISLKVANITYKNAHLENLVAKLLARDGIGNFKINSLIYSGADLTANFKVDGKTNTHNYDMHTENFNVGKLLRESDATDLLTGEIDFNLDIDTSGTTTQQLASNANGGFSAFMTNGSLDNAPIDLLATNLVKELLPGKKKESHTKIECFFTQFRGKNGLFKSEATLLNTKNIVMTASGDINLAKEKYDLTLVPKPKNISLFTLDSDVLVTGPLNDPDFSISKGSLFKKVLQSAAVVALGPAALAVPFTTIGSNKYTECFEEVADTTTKAVNAQQDAQEEEEAEKNDDQPSEAKVESINP